MGKVGRMSKVFREFKYPALGPSAEMGLEAESVSAGIAQLGEQ